MKKIISILLAVCICVGLCACGGSNISTVGSQNAADKDSQIIPSETECHHSWNEADCINARKCVICGKTTGVAVGHNFTNATCQKPKTCSRCGYTEGSLAEHSYKSMKCTICGAKDPQYEKIQQALMESERYIKYGESDITFISNNIELYKMTGNVKYLGDLIDAVNSATDSLDGIIKKCSQYDELKLLVDECYYSLPAVSSSNQSSVKAYLSAANKLVNTIKKTRATYLAYCEQYDVVYN